MKLPIWQATSVFGYAFHQQAATSCPSIHIFVYILRFQSLKMEMNGSWQVKR
jgi:hypothetical protein